jgi:hypothetical protein
MYSERETNDSQQTFVLFERFAIWICYTELKEREGERDKTESESENKTERKDRNRDRG